MEKQITARSKGELMQMTQYSANTINSIRFRGGKAVESYLASEGSRCIILNVLSEQT